MRESDNRNETVRLLREYAEDRKFVGSKLRILLLNAASLLERVEPPMVLVGDLDLSKFPPAPLPISYLDDGESLGIDVSEIKGASL